MADESDLTDEELLARVPDEREIFALFVDRYEEKLRRYVRRIMPSVQEETDDLLQEIFIKVYVNARGFDPSLSVNSWVYRIAHNETVSWLRKKKARPQLVDLGQDECHTFLQGAAIAQDIHEATLARDEVSRALADMPEKYRTVLVLRFLEGKTYNEIADILTVPSGTVATLVHRAKKAFSSIAGKNHVQR